MSEEEFNTSVKNAVLATISRVNEITFSEEGMYEKSKANVEKFMREIILRLPEMRVQTATFTPLQWKKFWDWVWGKDSIEEAIGKAGKELWQEECKESIQQATLATIIQVKNT